MHRLRPPRRFDRPAALDRRRRWIASPAAAPAPLGSLASLAALAVVAGVCLLGTPGMGAPEPAASGTHLLPAPVTLLADSLTVDNAGTTLLAQGHVRLAYKSERAAADLLRLDRSTMVGVLSGHATVTDPEGRASADAITVYLTRDGQASRIVFLGKAGVETARYAITADRIEADRRSDRLTAVGNLTVFSAPDLIVTGERGVYDRRTQYGVIRGHPVVESREGRIEGDWMEIFRAENRAVVHGPAKAEVFGATITGADVSVDLKRATAVIAGAVRIVRRQGTLQADRVTIFYDARRIIAEGTTHATFVGAEESPLP